MSVAEVSLKKRTALDIQTEYSNIIFKTGTVQYKIHQNQKDLELLNKELRDLSFEYSKVKAEEDAAAAAAKEASNAAS